ncbi:MAG: sigma-70 family RNA polymerase sigma factor [Clostridia bacterium]|nr:sigma-70 family RNA polymerase sigma factor [Clostridia bacterium]
MIDNEWMSRLHAENYALVLRHVRRQLYASVGHVADAEDITQEVFARALKKKDLHKHPNPTGWLITTATRLCQNYNRSTLSRQHTQQRYVQNKLDVRADRSLFLFNAENDQTDVSDLEMTLEQSLSKEDWLLLKEYYIEKTPVKEIARRMYMSENAVRVRVFRCRKKLKKSEKNNSDV